MSLRRIITMIGVKQATVGLTFIYHGPCPACEGCEYRKVCVENLEPGRVYRIVGLRERVFPCRVHEGGVRVVEVVEADVEAALPSKVAIEGATITFQPRECGQVDCEHYNLCFPVGLFRGDHCAILKVGERIRCREGLSLTRVVLRRTHAS